MGKANCSVNAWVLDNNTFQLAAMKDLYYASPDLSNVFSVLANSMNNNIRQNDADNKF